MENREVVTLGAGCFWCIEAVFDRLKGVESVQSGYSGGSIKNPAYREVCQGRTGHAEVVQIKFDPTIVSFQELLAIFFSTHNPTTLNRQGADVGTQYRSVIFYHAEKQKVEAEKGISVANELGEWGAPIVTEVAPFKEFYPAENVHNDYFALHGEAPYCQAVIKPKVDKLESKFKEKLK